MTQQNNWFKNDCISMTEYLMYTTHWQQAETMEQYHSN